MPQHKVRTQEKFLWNQQINIMQNRPESMGQSYEEKANMNNAVGTTKIELNTKLKRS